MNAFMLPHELAIRAQTFSKVVKQLSCCTG